MASQTNELSRRRFLEGLGLAGLGAGGVAVLRPAEALARIITEPAGGTARAAGTFGRIFALGPFADFNAPTLRAALMAMGTRGGVLDARDPLDAGPVRLITEPALSPGNLDNPAHTAGTTFMGQFLDHDMTFDEFSPLGVPTPPEQSRNTRTPGFDLDSVYGAGPAGSPQLYDPADTAKFRVQSGGLFEDLPRNAAGSAVIADPRNDENLMIAGLHAAFLLFHNRVVDLLRGQGRPNVFTSAQQLSAGITSGWYCTNSCRCSSGSRW